MAKTLAEKIAIMQAAERGEEIEMCSLYGGEWRKVNHPAWNWIDYAYRVKKELLTFTRYFIMGPEEIPVSMPFTDPHQAHRACEFLKSQTTTKPFHVVAFEMKEIENAVTK